MVVMHISGPKQSMKSITVNPLILIIDEQSNAKVSDF